MAQTQPQRRVDYWRMAWDKRPRSQFFTAYRAIPSLLVATTEFLIKYFKYRSGLLMDLWIALGTIIVVYLLISGIVSLSSFVVISPVNIHAMQAETISRLTEQNCKLHEVAYPKVSPEEERKRKLVADKLKYFDRKSKQVMRYIWDSGIVHNRGIYGDSGFGVPEVNEALGRGKLSGLLILNGDMVEINPELKAAIDFVLKSEGL